MPYTWTALPDSAVGAGGRPRGSVITALRDNIIAALQGAAGAQRVQLAALENLTAGSVIRSRVDGEQSVAGTTNQIAHAFAFIQSGTIRIFAEHKQGAGGFVVGSILDFVRWRNGAETVLSSWSNDTTSYAARSADVSVEPGDTLIIRHRHVSSNTVPNVATSYVANCRFQTSGERLWPIGPYVRVE